MIDKLKLSISTLQTRHQFGEDDISPIDIFSLVKAIKTLTLIIFPFKKSISGLCIHNPSSSIIAINSRMSLGRQRFTLAHELYHLLYDQDKEIVCRKDFSYDNENEHRADLFASYLLMPPLALQTMIQKYKKTSKYRLTLHDIIEIEQTYGISHQALLTRLKEEKEINSDQFDAMQNGVISLANRMGFDCSLYKPSEDKIQVYGYYISQVDFLYQNDIISKGKYEELLLDAFRDDIVYGNDEGGEFLD